MTGTPAERVAAGAAMLDQRIPGWHQEIDLKRLRLWSAYDCIVGQLGGDGDYLAGIFRVYPGDEPNRADEHGFIWESGESWADAGIDEALEADALEAAWREEIGRRRAQLAQEWVGFHERSGK